MMRKGIYIVETGELELVYGLGNAVSPAQNMEGRAVVDVPAGFPDTKAWDAATLTFVADTARLDAELIAGIKGEAEGRKLQLLSTGAGKIIEYAEKRQEVIAFDTGGLDGIGDQTVMFAHARADAAAHGDTLQDAIARFRAGIAGAASLATIAAAEAAACSAVRAARSAAAKRRAAEVSWP